MIDTNFVFEMLATSPYFTQFPLTDTLNHLYHGEITWSVTEKSTKRIELQKKSRKKAKIIAVKKNTSLSGLLRDYLTEIVKKDEAYQLAKTRHCQILKKGYDLGLKGKIFWKREELHER